jgi:tRNA A-37 threonylcarbamoyl transferase component Bud32
MNSLSQSTFHPLYFASTNDFAPTPEVMLSKTMDEFETTKEDCDHSRKHPAASSHQRATKESSFLRFNLGIGFCRNAHDNDDDEDDDGTISTTSTSLSTAVDDSSCRLSDDVRDTLWSARQRGRGDRNNPNNDNGNNGRDNGNVEVDNEPIVGLASVRTDQKDAGGQGSGSFLFAKKLHSTIYSEPPLCLSTPLSTCTTLSKKREQSDLFLSHLHNNDNNADAVTGSFVVLRAKRKSPGSPGRFDLKAALLQETIYAVRAEHQDALKTAAAMKLRLKKAQAQIRALEEQRLVQEQQHRQELQDFLLGYFPDNPVNYSHYVGPLQSHVTESATEIGSYSIVRHLGEGGFATVVECLDRITKKHYAMKKLDKAKMLSRFALASLSNELRVLSQVRHDNIISCYEVLNGETHVYVVMELGHTSLYEYYNLHGSELNTTIHREMAIGMFQGLEYLHSIGIAHLDMKLENILVKSSVSPRDFSSRDILLADFGLCSIANGPMDDIVIEDTLGTLGFYAPEMKLLGIAEGRKADLWSAGVTLLELVEGLPLAWMDAYAEEDPDYFRAELEDCLVIVADRDYFTSPVVHDLVMQLLDWTPANRPTCLEVLNHDFLRDDSHLPVVEASNHSKRHCLYENCT